MSLSEPGEMGDSQSDSQSTESVFRPIRTALSELDEVGSMPSRETLLDLDLVHNGDVFYILDR